MQKIPTPVSISPLRNLPDICIAAIDEVLSRSREEEIPGNGEFIHQIRILTKRLRAAWNLARGMVPHKKVKERRTALREISARFSGHRDQAVLKKLCADLAEGRSIDQEGALRSLGGAIVPPDSGSLIPPDELAKLFEEERREWRALDWRNREDWGVIIARRIGKSYRKARKTTKMARKAESSETWHNWRKAIKQLRYQREFLAELEDRPLTDFETQVGDLGSLLGQRNDLANLEKHIDSKKAGLINVRGSLDSAIDESTSKIIKKCRRLGKKLFRAKKPL